MLVLRDDIWTGKRCVAGEIVADGAHASTSHGLMVLCRHVAVLAKYQHLVANERGQIILIDATMTDGQMTHVKAFSHIVYCEIRYSTLTLSSRRYC